MTNSPGYQSLRKGRVSIPGQIYILTTVTVDRRPLFACHEYARPACRAVTGAFRQDCHLLSWVLMPDHWHGLLQLGDEASLSKVMNRWKSLVSRHLHHAGYAGAVWQPGYHDRALRREDDVRQAGRYVVANPLRAGLVESVGQYPYWDSVWLGA